MVATFNRTFVSTGAMSLGEGSGPTARCQVRQKLRRLADVLGGATSELLQSRLFEAEQAAIMAETRIAELENHLEEMRRRENQRLSIRGSDLPPVFAIVGKE